MAIESILCFITKDGKVLLQKKAKGLFGELKWNAPGGKLMDGETAEACAIREVEEETGLFISDPKPCGILHFYKDSKKDAPAIIVHVFLTSVFEGAPRDLGEGELKWFDPSKLPFHEMWEDDKFWLPHVLAGKSINGHFFFTGDFDKIFDYKLEVF